MSISYLARGMKMSLLNRVLVETTQKYVRWKYRAVIFDMGGVILPSPFPMTKEYEAIKKIPAGTIWKAIKECGDKGAWPKLEVGELNSEQFGEIFSDECSAAANETVDVRDFLKYLEHGMKDPIQEVLDAVACLREEGYKTALLTNNWIQADGETLLPFPKETFDIVIESAKVGLNKPNPGIYNLTLNRLGVQAGEAIFLDDMQPNITAAKSLGIYTIKVEDVHVAIAELERSLNVALASVTKGTRPVRKDMEFPLGKFTEYMKEKLNLDVEHEPVVRQFSHGQSNPTYMIDFGPSFSKHVLRKKPPGKLLPSAHAVEREYRVMYALGKHGVPVPHLVDLCEDDSIIGTPFYVMELVQGNIYKNPSLPGMSPPTRKEVYDKMMDTLCRIHRVDVEKAGLTSYGKQGNYVTRQVKTWSKQYRASETREIPSMERLMTWLPDHLPQKESTTVVHGDFRIDNLIYRRDQPEVLAVLDWELSTLGDPLSDLAYCCLPYFLPQNFPIIPGLKGVNLQELGIPSHEQLLEMYCEKMGIPLLEDFNFYMAFCFFRVAAILQGVYKRSTAGQASSAKAAAAGKLAENMADVGWTFAAKEGFRLFNKTNPDPLGSGPASISSGHQQQD